MLCFDIETTGLDWKTSFATVACTYDGVSSKAYHFHKPCSSPGPQHPNACSCTRAQAKLGCSYVPGGRCAACTDWHTRNLEALFTALDAAPVLCGFNAVGFDIPYLQRRYGVDGDRAGRYVLGS